MASKYFPNVDDPAVQENLHLFNLFSSTHNLCGKPLFFKYKCNNCPFGHGIHDCSLYYSLNPHLRLFVKELEIKHPEIFV